MPEATAHASPPDEPPALRSRSCGLRVEPNSRFDESQNIENSETLVLPSRIAPAVCSRRTGSHV